jgi:hypothetical protein
MSDDAAPPGARLRSILLTARAGIVPVAAGLWAALGTFWSIYAWYHQEVVVPSTAPVNLTTDVTVEEVGTGRTTAGASEEQLEAIQIMVTANNVSTKTIHLLANYWDAWAGKVASRLSATGPAPWLQDINKMQAIQNETGRLHYATSGRHYGITTFERVAWGNLFPTSYILHPKETISASTLFYVPKGAYDMVHVEVHSPTTELQTVELLFVVDTDRVKPKFYQIGSNGERKEVTAKADIEALKIQETEALRQLSLWKSSTPSNSQSPKTTVP